MSNATAPERPIILLDTSTAIALVLRDHEDHATAVAAVRGRTLGLAGHAWFETYSVLTRLPSGRRRSQEDALRVLRHDFPETRLTRMGLPHSSTIYGHTGLAAERSSTPWLALVRAPTISRSCRATYARWRPIARSGSGSNYFRVSLGPPDEVLHKAVFEDVRRLISRD